MPWALLSAHLSGMTQLYAWKHVWFVGLLMRKQWLFKIPAINCVGDFLHIFQESLEKLSLGIFQDLLEKHKLWGSQFAISPKASEFKFIEFCTLYLPSMLAALILSLWWLQLPHSSSDMSLSLVIILAVCMSVSQTTSLPCQPGHLEQWCCFSVTFEHKGERKMSPHPWMVLLGYKISAQIKWHYKQHTSL